MIWVMNHIGHF